MLPEKGGITIATNLPEVKTLPKYVKSDILLSNIRPYFKKIWFANRTGGCSNDVLVVKPFAVDPKFLYYVLSDNNFFNYSTVTSKGTKMPRGSQPAIMKYLVPDVGAKTQTRIADILSAYDDAIENNNRRIALLEKAAHELYKEWFVRFRFPGHENAKFVNGLPEGWKVKRIATFTHVTDGTHDTPKQTDFGVPLITGRCISNGFIDFDSAYMISEADHASISKRSGLETGDILFSNIGTVGSTCIVDYYREFSVKNVIIFKPESKTKTAYLYLLLTSQTMQDIFQAQTNGASQQFVGLTFIRRFKIVVPNEEMLSGFSEYVSPLLAERQLLHKQSQNLARQRDMLLPRLMSGKLEV
jgi:type I restriction enzyme S subunit